jgi:hypothetical protein
LLKYGVRRSALPYVMSALWILDATREEYMQSTSSFALPMSKEANVQTCCHRLALRLKTCLRRVIGLRAG